MRDRAIPILLLAAAALPAQVRQIRESPAASVSQDLGLTKVAISYHRPAVKGRVIWGGLVPYGQVWRTGANEATTFSFSTAVKVAGHEVPAGTYAFFAIPAKDHWTLILNKTADQWGAFSYKQDQDLLRFDVAPAPTPMQEWLDYTLEVKDQGTAIATLRWEKLQISFPITADVDGIYQAYLADEVKKADASADPKRMNVYLVDARYWTARGQRLDEASASLDKAAAIRESFWVYDLRARILQKQGRVKEALPLLDQAMALAPKQGAPKEYVDGLAALKAEWSK
ncbi:MAG TPA: DUF2911 domain-containing protein [Holophagaceae bacterium]|jgi:hypothetical protein|nr:DUF2911 domain-containing protein [Holophagaceae bacterium]